MIALRMSHENVWSKLKTDSRTFAARSRGRGRWRGRSDAPQPRKRGRPVGVAPHTYLRVCVDAGATPRPYIPVRKIFAPGGLAFSLLMSAPVI